MNKQGSPGFQGSNAPQQPDSHMPNPNDPVLYKPTDRADVAPRSLEERPREYQDGDKTRKQNAQGIPQYVVTVVSGRYDKENHKWMYILDDWRNERIDGETPETELG